MGFTHDALKHTLTELTNLREENALLHETLDAYFESAERDIVEFSALSNELAKIKKLKRRHQMSQSEAANMVDALLDADADSAMVNLDDSFACNVAFERYEKTYNALIKVLTA